MELKLDRLTKQFGAKIAVDRVSATLIPGVTGLLGANGAGKTTLMRMVCDVLRPTSGQILLDGTDAGTLGDEYRAMLGYLPQDFGYYPDFTALDFMRYMATLKKTFSGGMKQRLGIAQAMINDQAILVLDEPTSGLDPKERVRFRNLIAGFAQDKIVILSTHIVSDVEFIAGRILVMNNGAFVMDGAPDQVVSQAAGKVWECHVEAGEAEHMSTLMTVANVRYSTDGRAVVRVVADDAPTVDAYNVEPTLEDLYLHVFSDADAR